MGKFMERCMIVFRISFGDNNFDSSQILSEFQVWIFWVVFLMVVSVTCIIFMNFIIAQVSQVYEEVTNQIIVLLLKQRGLMITEAEEMLRARFGKNKVRNWQHLFPRYVITREADE